MRSAKESRTQDRSKTAVREADSAGAPPRRAESASAASDLGCLMDSAKGSGIARVPTHAVGRVQERRAYIRARLSLPIRVQRVAGQRDSKSHSLHTRDISSSGVFFNYPLKLDPGTPIEVEVLLVDRPTGRGSVRMRTAAHIVRVEDTSKPGWHGLAATFDEISFVRDESVASS